MAETAREVQLGQETTATGLREVTSSVAAVKKDGETLASSAETTAAMLEETARSIKGVGVNAEDLAAASEQLLAAAT